MVEYKAWEIEKTGSIQNIRMVSKTISDDLLDGNVLVDIKAIGLNFADVFSVLGLYENAPKTTFVPGLEFSGVVAKKHPSVENFEVGDRVMGVTKFGSYSTKIVSPAFYLTKIPESWSFEQGAAFLVQVLTAYYAIVELGRSKKGESVLIHSIAGGVGLLAVDIAKKIGMEVIGTLSSDAKKKFVCEQFDIPEDMIIVRENPKHFEESVREALKKRNRTGLDLVLDSLSGDYFQPGLDLLGVGGKYIFFGSGTFMPEGNLGLVSGIKLGINYLRRPTIDPMKLMSQSKTLSGLNLYAYFDKTDDLKEVLDKVMAMDLRAPTVGKQFDFEHVIDSLLFLQSGKNIGKVVVTVS